LQDVRFHFGARNPILAMLTEFFSASFGKILSEKYWNAFRRDLRETYNILERLRVMQGEIK